MVLCLLFKLFLWFLGYVAEIDALVCGRVTHRLGSGRHSPEDDIDYTAGLKLLVSVGTRVSKGKFSIDTFSPLFSLLIHLLLLARYVPNIAKRSI